MKGITVWLVVWIAFMVETTLVLFLPLPIWGKLLVAALYGAAVGWGIMRWKGR